jgi:hypothetical protein
MPDCAPCLFDFPKFSARLSEPDLKTAVLRAIEALRLTMS